MSLHGHHLSMSLYIQIPTLISDRLKASQLNAWSQFAQDTNEDSYDVTCSYWHFTWVFGYYILVLCVMP